jgi:signal recognition particle receptor subunit beta
LLILAHKSDLLKSSATSETLAINRVKTILERELEKRRASQAGGIGVEGLGDEGERSDLGGLECVGTSGEFRFADWEGGEVTFLTSSVEIGQTKEEGGEKDTQQGLSALRDWLNEL